MCAVNDVPVPVVSLIEGAVMGGGFGLVCVSDVALSLRDARFGLPETGLGLIPAQIAPFVVQRVGLTHARRLMLTGARLDGAEAARLGLVHAVYDDVAALEAGLASTLTQIQRCAPLANSATKRLLLSVEGRPLVAVLDEAAQVFAEASVGEEAREGTLAFVEKRLPKWAK
jgi:isohexenylglutaconyl-CoA hydratase